MKERRGVTVLLLGLGVAIGAYVLYPAGVMVAGSLSDAGSLTADRYRDVFDMGNAANREAVVNSVVVSFLSVAGSALLGVLLALVITQIRFPFSGLIGRLAVLPVALPPLVGVIAFLLVFGESGTVPRLTQAVLGADSPPFFLDGIPAVVAVHVYSFNVYFYLFASAALRDLDGSLFEAAASLGAGAWRTFRFVVLPALRPAVTGAAILTFMASMASFSAPFLFGGEHRFLTVQIYLTKLNGDMELAAAQSMLLMVVTVGFFLMLHRAGGARRAVAKGVARRTPMLFRPATRRLLIATAVVLILLELLPLFMILLVSVVREGSWTWQLFPERFTLANYGSVFEAAGSLEAVKNSVAMALVAGAAALVLGVAGAYVIVRGRIGRWSGPLDVILTVPYAIPGTVVAIALIMAFDQPSVLAFGRTLVGTFWILPLAYVVRTYPLVVRSTGASLEAIDESLFEAGAALGAGPWRRFRRVVLPLASPGIVAGVVLVVIAAVGEFVSSILLYAYDSRPISVEILARMRMFQFGTAAALCVVVLAIILALVGVAGRIRAGRPGRFFPPPRRARTRAAHLP